MKDLLRNVRHFRGHKFFRFLVFILGACALTLMVRTSSDYYTRDSDFLGLTPDSLSKVDTFVDKNDVTSSTTASVSVSAVKNKTKTKKSYHSKKPKDENDQVCFLFSFLVVDVELRVFT